MPNDATKIVLKANFGIVLKITDKKNTDGLRSGIKIVTMEKSDHQSNPIPSYIQVSGWGIYVTYEGQVIICKYCDDTGHVQSECHKGAIDFPVLTHSKPRKSSTAVPEKNAYLNQLNNTSNHL